jgi:uncharacterized membrane protein
MAENTARLKTMMQKHKPGLFKRLTLNIRNRLISGIFLIVPFAVTIVVVRWLFQVLAGFLRPIVAKVIEWIPRTHPLQEIPAVYIQYAVSLATILSLLLIIYLVGAIAKFVAGRRLLAIGEKIVLRIPLARTIYTATKQVTTALSLQDNPAFKSVVLVEFPRRGAYAVGFLTGMTKDSLNNAFCKVFIPTTPNPTTGFFELISADEVLQTEMTIEEAFKMIISGGIVSPDILKITRSVEQTANKQS